MTLVLNFESISLKKQAEYSEYLATCSQKVSDYSFINLWGWAKEHGLEWAWTDDLVWIRQTVPQTRYWAPVGRWKGIDWKSCLDEFNGTQVRFIRIPEKLLRSWKESCGDRIKIAEERGSWDYIYSVAELSKLAGKRFHKKKNLLNQFKKKYDFKYISFDSEMIDKAMSMQQDWCTWRDCESSEALTAENNAISRILINWERLNGLVGAAIIVNETMAAYTVAESLSKDMLLIHFEKGNPDFKGIYQAINQMFLQNSAQNHKVVNREQDLDNEGVRKAKLSYHPVGFLKKYAVTLL